MNERIQELIKQCSTTSTSYFDGRGNVTSTFFDKEKFAELIVKDTINILKQEWYDWNSAPNVEGETPRDVGLRVGAKSQTIRLMHMIQKYFGIKE